MKYVGDGWLCKRDDCEEVLQVWSIWIVWAFSLLVYLCVMGFFFGRGGGGSEFWSLCLTGWASSLYAHSPPTPPTSWFGGQFICFWLYSVMIKWGPLVKLSIMLQTNQIAYSDEFKLKSIALAEEKELPADPDSVSLWSTSGENKGLGKCKKTSRAIHSCKVRWPKQEAQLVLN